MAVCFGFRFSQSLSHFKNRNATMNILRNVRLKDYRSVYAKHFSTEPSTNNRYKLEQLKNRSLLRLQGDLVAEFLQSLITNDINHLSQQSGIFTMFLNKAGRVLHDAIIYNTKEKTQLLVECDAQANVELVKHLKMFRVRKKIDIDVADDLTIWVAFNPDEAQKDLPNDKLIDLKNMLNGDELITCTDPRIQNLGVRIIAANDNDIVQKLSQQNISLGNPNDYQIHRYKLGVAEGIDELPYAKCFPLESNCDFLHGVSFHKGCYLGQEFTARTHHTGVIRKRLMPLQLVGQLTATASKHIETTHGDAVGKLRGFQQDWGLGLLKVDVALQETAPFVLGGTEVYVKGSTYRPFWWPSEAPKLNELKSKEL